MNRAAKWGLSTVGIVLVLVFAGLLILPKFINVQKYKPMIEKQVADATGRSFFVGGDLRLSLFPWAGVSFSDLKLGSLSGFAEKDFVTVKAFEVRVKLIPLLFKDIQVKRFAIDGARVVLEKNKDGGVNWDFSKKARGQPAAEPPAGAKKPSEKLPVKSLDVKDFAVTDASVVYVDHAKKLRKEISEVNLRLQDFSMERPVRLFCSALVDGRPLSFEGDVGPLGKEVGKGPLPMNLTMKALKQFEARLKGQVVDAASDARFDLELDVASFSPRKLLASLGRTLPVATADPKALERLAFRTRIAGDTRKIALSNGLLELDDSTMKFSVKAGAFEKPDVKFDLDLDRFDADRYLPPPAKETPSDAGEKGETTDAGKKQTDYGPLRRLVLNGTARIGELKIKNARLENIQLKISGENGVFRLDPFNLSLYQGSVSGKGALDVRKDAPGTRFDVDAREVRAGPLLRDVLKKDVLEGALKAALNLSVSGDTPDQIKKTVSGEGDLLFTDGAVKGVDLAQMVRNVKEAFGLTEKPAQKPKTDFAELRVPFSIERGLAKTANTALISPLLRVTVAGQADLVAESLNLRVEPKFVATLKGQGDDKQRSGITVPVLIGGSFASPRFRPDLEGMLKKSIEKGLPDLQKSLEGNEKGKGIEDQIKGIFKGLPLGK